MLRITYSIRTLFCLLKSRYNYKSQKVSSVTVLLFKNPWCVSLWPRKIV